MYLLIAYFVEILTCFDKVRCERIVGLPGALFDPLWTTILGTVTTMKPTLWDRTIHYNGSQSFTCVQHYINKYIEYEAL